MRGRSDTRAPPAPAGPLRRAAPIVLLYVYLNATRFMTRNSSAPFVSGELTHNNLPMRDQLKQSFSFVSNASVSKGSQDEQCTEVLDIAFVVDESGSIGIYNFGQVQKFLAGFLELLPISKDEVRCAVVLYGEDVRVLWGFGHHQATNKEAAVKQISSVNYGAGRATNTGPALAKTHQLLITGVGARQQVPKVLVLLTDGSSSNRSATIKSAANARQNGIQIFVIGVGNANGAECRTVCGCSTYDCPQYMSSSWSGLGAKVSKMFGEVCKKLPKDAACSPWSEWSTCSVSCGGGVRKKTRVQISDPLPGDPPCDGCPGLMGKKCEEKGGLEFLEQCSLEECPVNAGCGEWGPWSAPSATCGLAMEERRRVRYNQPGPVGAGLYCEQQSPAVLPEEKRQVSLPPCITEVFQEWSSWGQCDVTCGSGSRRRTRVRRIHTEGEDQVKEEHEEEVEKCNMTPCPVNAYCGEFGEWSPCSKSCGGGTSVRVRSPWNNDQQYGGQTCLQQHPDGREQRRNCNTEPCPVDEPLGEWEDWGQCSVSCGKGVAKRYRIPSPIKAAYGGSTVEERVKAGTLQAELEETKACHRYPCGSCTFPFTPWSECQGTCGNGYRDRHTGVKFDYQTRKCSLPTYEMESCIPAGCGEGAGGAAGESGAPSEQGGTGGGAAGGGGAPGEGTAGKPEGAGGRAEEPKQEAGGVPVAAIAGGIVGGVAVLGAIAGGAYYSLAGKAGAAASGPGQAEFGEQAAQEAAEEEREAMIGIDEESEMWRA